MDLGVIPGLFGEPQRYADLLEQEISYRTKQPLLVAMPTGFGVQGVSARAARAVATLPRPAGKRSDDLARAATGAVAELAKVAGHPIRRRLRGPGGHRSRGGATTPLVIALALSALIAAAALAIVAVRRRRTAA